MRYVMQEFRCFEGCSERMGNGEQGKLQAGGQGERTGGAAEERGVESGEGDRQTGSHQAGSKHQTAQLVYTQLPVL